MSPNDQVSVFSHDNAAPCVPIGPRSLGVSHPPVFWPDIDVYFRRDLGQAFKLIDLIAEAGGQYLKGAVLHRESLCLKGGTQISYFDKNIGRMISEPFEDVIARHVVPLDMLEKVMHRASKAGLGLVLSVYDSEGLAFARAVGALAIKLPSSNITHKALIEEVAACGLPMVIDTGRSKFQEIERAVAWARQKGAGKRLVIQHSPPPPPAPATRFHLRMMGYMARVFSCPTGLSDHHSGLAMLPIAVALGASVIEKGLVMDGTASDIDIAHAMPASRLREALLILEESWQSLGENLRPDDEVPSDPVDRMCVIARRHIAAGDTITLDMLDFALPPLGIGVAHLDAVIGSTALKAISRGTPIGWEMTGQVYED